MDWCTNTQPKVSGRRLASHEGQKSGRPSAPGSRSGWTVVHRAADPSRGVLEITYERAQWTSSALVTMANDLGTSVLASVLSVEVEGGGDGPIPRWLVLQTHAEPAVGR